MISIGNKTVPKVEMQRDGYRTPTVIIAKLQPSNFQSASYPRTLLFIIPTYLQFPIESMFKDLTEKISSII